MEPSDIRWKVASSKPDVKVSVKPQTITLVWSCRMQLTRGSGSNISDISDFAAKSEKSCLDISKDFAAHIMAKDAAYDDAVYIDYDEPLFTAEQGALVFEINVTLNSDVDLDPDHVEKTWLSKYADVT